MSIIISKYIRDDTDIDDLVIWAEDNCTSFEKYMLVELDWEEKQELSCWFRLDVYFGDDKDAMMYSLRWV